MSPQVRNTAIAAGIYIAAVGTAWYTRGHGDWAETAITLAFIWLITDRLAQHERDEDTRADVDELAAKLDKTNDDLHDLDTIRGDLWAIKQDLTGNVEPAGRHAPPAQRKPSPRPRSVA